MKPWIYELSAILLMTALVVSILPGCTPVAEADSYMAIVPKVLRAGAQEAVSLTLFAGDEPGSSNVEVALLDDGREVAKAEKRITGKGRIEIDIPDLEEGQYEIRVKGDRFEDKASIGVEKNSLVFLETDKPIYKPGHTIHMRVITLNPDLRPSSESVTLDVLDAKGIKVFRTETRTDDFGMVTLDLPVSEEPNLGVWKVKATSAKGETQLDVRVEEYVLPKYEVKAELPREWFLVNEAIRGTVKAEYSFGKPVRGQLEIRASRYVGDWKEYATFTDAIDAEVEFEIPAAEYVAGVPAAGGQGNVMLEITVTERGSGYEESSTMLLTVVSSPLTIKVIPDSSVFKPGLPFNFLVVTGTPDNKPTEASVDVTVTYLNEKFKEVGEVKKDVTTSKGKAMVEVVPPADAVALSIECFELTERSSVQPARTTKYLEAGYSPSGNFIHLEQTSEGIPEIGERIAFRVHATREAANFYYEVVSRDRVVFTDFTSDNEISFAATPQMTPSSKLLVYQILPNSEVAADFVPFQVVAEYPHSVDVQFSREEAKPGDQLNVNVVTEGRSKVGIVAVDRSVYILAENRLNLQQVFDELERLYMEPQAELHELSIYVGVETRGAKDVFEEAGVVVLSNNRVPEGKEYKDDREWGPWLMLRGALAGGEGMEDWAIPMPQGPPGPDAAASMKSLAEVQRIRQYFPETWIWDEIITDSEGRGSLRVDVPDTITTWMLRAVAISREQGLGIAEAQLKAFQPFFLKADLPYSAIRGEEFPVKIAVYNYLDEPQSVVVEIDEADWLDILDDSIKTVEIAPNDIGGVEFQIRPTELGVNELKVTARSEQAADAVIKTLIVEPEGVARESVENLVLSDGSTRVNTDIPVLIVDGSGRAYVAVTSSFLTQTIEGLDQLLKMPMGCGEQNMILFAPDVFITKYLQESGQLKPEIMAKAEKLMITGYQRELTYRHGDGSFSAFGENDKEGSLFLTAFVLKCFAQAKDVMYIDEDILREAQEWIASHQNADGSFDTVGFVSHQEMMGGLEGKNALTAYVAIALLEAGERTASGKAVRFLEEQLEEIDDPYTMAIVSYALELGGSSRVDEAHGMLIDLAEEDESGLHWGDVDVLLPEPGFDRIMPRGPMMPNKSVAIEATGYATLALIEHGDAFNASRAAKWLVSQRNAYGGYGSTQDTVVALQALTGYSSQARADVDLAITIDAGGEETHLSINRDNFDVLQIVAVPVNEGVEITVDGKGEAITQVVKRFNLPDTEERDEILKLEVEYDTTEVEVNDLVRVSVDLEFAPPIYMEAGMVVADISVPTGFAPVRESIQGVVEGQEKVKRYDIAGRKVIFYVENLLPGDSIAFSFHVRAMYPVRAKGVTSEAYSYYKPEIRGEVLGEAVTVS
jgi:CD109 antigen